MAIPFYELADGDQVDGHVTTNTATLPPAEIGTSFDNYAADEGYDAVDYEAPPPPPNSSNQSSSTTQTTAATESAATTEEQLIAWKLLALAMCKALKHYYTQNGNSSNSFSGAFSVQLLPNGNVKPL